MFLVGFQTIWVEGGVCLQAIMIYKAKKIYVTSRPFPRHCFFSLNKIQFTKFYQLFLLDLWTQTFKFIYTLSMQAAFTKHTTSLSTLLLTFTSICFYAVIICQINLAEVKADIISFLLIFFGHRLKRNTEITFKSYT